MTQSLEPEMRERLSITARHEAGHVIAAQILQQPSKVCVALVRDSKSGEVLDVEGWTEFDLDSLDDEGYVLGYVAGVVAEGRPDYWLEQLAQSFALRAAGMSPQEVDTEIARRGLTETDGAAIFRRLHRFGPERAREMYAVAVTKAQSMLKERQQAFDQMTETLISHAIEA